MLISFKYLFLIIQVNYIIIVSSLEWEYAITTNSKILFYNDNWELQHDENHKYETTSALDFDPFDDVLFYSSRNNLNGTIFALKLHSIDDKYHSIHKIKDDEIEIQQTKKEIIEAVTYDPLERNLYWTDSQNKIIYRLKLDSDIKNTSNKAEIFMQFNKKIPHGITIDVCERNLYWTNRHSSLSSIEVISLKDSSPVSKTLTTNVIHPLDIAINYNDDRIYWIDDRLSSKIDISSINKDGTEKKEIFFESNEQPHNLIVNNDSIYWIDKITNSIYKIDMNGTNKMKLLSLNTSTINAVALNKHLIKNIFDSKGKCKDVYLKITNDLNDFKNYINKIKNNSSKTSEIVCEKCKECPKFDEIHKCINFCLHGGECYLLNGFPECRCKPGYNGIRCEKRLCDNYCLNDGICSIVNDQPVCECSELTGGRRCEKIDHGKICSQNCNDEQNLIGLAGRFSDVDIEKLCKSCNSVENAEPLCETNNNQQISYTAMTKSVFIITSGIVLSLLIVLLIIIIARKSYKPLHPKIKKTFVVRKNLTPLTSRPDNGCTTEQQCEITIEDCCNMNICETPCFDPKILQGENSAIVSDGRCIKSHKEDKRNLLSDMDYNGELY